MKPWVVASIDGNAIRELKNLVAAGEGLQLEFKRKASHPDKIVREMIALANTEGGTLLIGVDDNQTIPGVKYPEEEWHVIQQALKSYCRPALAYHESVIKLKEDRFVLRIDIPQSLKRPHFMKLDGEQEECYVRVNDMSMKASAELREIIRRSKAKKNIQFMYGEHEQQLMRFLEEHKTITLNQFKSMTGLNRFKSARKLILLVLANVIRIQPTEKGDLYSRA
jgi:Predicted transcriptional regulator containing an HTH domain and an uncharacterized domain shared with the mammalian protein Schlafen